MFVIDTSGEDLLYFCVSILACSALIEIYGEHYGKKERMWVDSVIPLYAAVGVLFGAIGICVSWYCLALYMFFYISLVSVLLYQGLNKISVFFMLPILVIVIKVFWK